MELPRGGRVRAEDELPSSADWADSGEIESTPELATARGVRDLQGQFVVGRTDDAKGRWLGYGDDRHIVTIAGSRAGKGRSAILPNLALWPGSVIVTDPKGENAALTAQRREAAGQTVAVLDPFGTTAQTLPERLRVRFNPLDQVASAASPVDEAGLLADALIVQEREGAGQHFTMAARNLLHGLILYHAVRGPKAPVREGGARGTLLDVRDALTAGNEAQVDLLAAMTGLSAGDQAEDGAIAAAAWSFLDKSDTEASSVLSTAQEQTAFLGSPAVRAVLAESDFKLDLLREKPGLSLYIALPARYLATHGRLMRMMVTLAFTAVEAKGTYRADEGARVLACLDEFAVLGHLSIIESAAGYMAGYGLILWPIIQDLSQLKRHYAQGWETFLGNAGLVQAFANTDATTLDYLEKRLGHRVILSQGISAQGVDVSKTQRSASLDTVPLLRAEEIGRYFGRDSGRQIALVSGRRPVIAQRTPWDRERELSRLLRR